MSLRYTGEATMDEPALRDVERWKDKIEVRLDNRQVFFLFFGSAMVACMLFVLGVIVGKRLESRGRAEAPPVEDPLAVLDRFGAIAAPATPPAALTFPKALIGGGPAKGKAGSVERASVEHVIAERPAMERAVAKSTLTAAAPLPLPVPVAPPAAQPKPAAVAPVKAATALQKLAALPKIAPSSPPASAPSSVASTSAAPVKKAVVAPRPVAAPASKPLVSAPSASAGKEPGQLAKVTTVPGASADKGKGRFLLQLSSFQDRAEADAFARRFAGQNAYVVASEIPGKGTWYRVRVGSYGTMQEAASAKTTFERDHNVIAYVAGSGPAK